MDIDLEIELEIRIQEEIEQLLANFEDGKEGALPPEPLDGTTLTCHFHEPPGGRPLPDYEYSEML